MKQWAIRIFIGLTLLGVLGIGAIAFFVKITLNETSLSLLEEKTQKNYDPYSSIYSQVILEEGSVVNREELKHFYLFSSEKNTFEEFFSRARNSYQFSPLAQSNELLQVDRDVVFKNLMQNDCKEIYCYQHYLPFDYIPSIFWRGLIGIEDQRYLDHFGVDLKSLFRALVTNLKTMRYAQGGSTISQQLVKNLFFTNEKTFIRKLKEMVVSIYVESQFSKEKILEAYLNEVHWGALQGIKIKGVLSASLFYFDKKPQEISPYEGAILISLLKGPNYFHPIRNLPRLKERAGIVFKKLIDEGMVANDPALIWTDAMWSAWHNKLKMLDKNRYHHSMWRTLNDQEPTLSQYEKFVLIHKVENVRRKISEKYDEKFNTLDISVKVMLGSINTNNWFSYYSRVERNKEKALGEEAHQVGSTIKPIIYSVYEDLGKSIDDEVETGEIKLTLKSGVWSPRESHRNVPEFVTLREALLKSLNRPLVRIARDLGFENVEQGLSLYLEDLKKPLAEYPSQLLGTSEYSMEGYRDLYSKFIKAECAKIKDGSREAEESVLYALSDPNQTTVLRAVDDVMQKLRFFGKTGTTNNGYDNWYVAFDGKNLTLIWVGYEGERKTKSLGLYGSTTAFDVFQNYYRDRGKRFHQFGCDSVN